MSDPEFEPADEPEVVVEAEEPAAPTVDPDIEAEARRLGWKPKEEFALDPKYWVEPDRFLEEPAVKFKAEQERTKALEERLARIDRATSTVVDKVRAQERATFEARLAQVRAEQTAAVQDADVDRFNTAKATEDRLLRAAPAAPVDDGLHPDVKSYVEKNAWTKDPELFNFAAEAIERTPGIKSLSPLKQVEWAERKVRAEFPDAFQEEPKRPQVSRVDGGGLASSPRAKAYSDLPAEARAACDKFVKQGFLTKEEYVKSYWSDNA
jgi:hypothetical protein